MFFGLVSPCRLRKLPAGGVCEVHLDPDWPTPVCSFDDDTSIDDFLDRWAHVEPLFKSATPDPTARYLGIVHVHGAALVRVPEEVLS